MTGWIIVALLAVTLNPLVRLVPSRRPRGQMDVRLEARRMGLAMRPVREERPYWMSDAPPGPCPQCHHPRPRGRQHSWCYWQREPCIWLNKWQEPRADMPLAERLATLPGDVYKAEATPQMIAPLWGERARPQSLQAITTFLKTHAWEPAQRLQGAALLR